MAYGRDFEFMIEIFCDSFVILEFHASISCKSFPIQIRILRIEHFSIQYTNILLSWIHKKVLVNQIPTFADRGEVSKSVTFC